MPATYEPIATITLTSSTGGQIFFSSIPATYTDLKVVFKTINSQASVYGYFNNDTASNYSSTNIVGNGSTASTNHTTSQPYAFMSSASLSSAQPAFVTIDILNYTWSKFKTAISTTTTDRNGSGSVGSNVSVWRSTAAINSIGFVAYISGTFQAGTTATLYGIKKA
jgi:hypothetical protein